LQYKVFVSLTPAEIQLMWATAAHAAGGAGERLNRKSS
jgi:hypothetical protein